MTSSTTHALTRSERASRAATARWSRQDGTKGTEAARSAFLARFEQQVDPTGQLDPAERQSRAAAARSEHFRNLATRRHHG